MSEGRAERGWRQGPKRRIQSALKRVRASISANVDRSSVYSGALSTEGYEGGYADALQDVLLVLNGVQPSTREYWRDWK